MFFKNFDSISIKNITMYQRGKSSWINHRGKVIAEKSMRKVVQFSNLDKLLYLFDFNHKKKKSRNSIRLEETLSISKK